MPPGGEQTGILGCKFCGKNRGTYYKDRNEFVCNTTGCEGSKRPARKVAPGDLIDRSADDQPV